MLFIVVFLALSGSKPALGYLQCAEMASYGDPYSGKSCTFANISDTYFSGNNWYQVKPRDSIQEVSVRFSKFNDLPSDLFARIPYLRFLDLSKCGLEELRKSSLQGAPKSLTHLNLTECDFKKIFQLMFGFTPEIMVLDLSSGKIEEVHENGFSGLKKLVYLKLNKNRIRKLSSKTFASLEHLHSLDLSDNQIDVLPAGLFLGSPRVQRLDVSSNSLGLLEEGFLDVLKMEFLDLSHNKIKEFDSKAMEVSVLEINDNEISELHIWTSTKFINASSNNISVLSCDEHLSLEDLLLSGNSIASFECISKASSLKRLDLSYNTVGRLNYSSFSRLTELQDLRLSHANLSNIVLGVFSHQEHLEVLDISYNQLENLPFSMLLAAKNLKELYIDGNNIAELPYRQLESTFPALRTLGIGDNWFTCAYLSEIFAFFNPRFTNIIASKGNKTTHSANIKGIQCQETQEPLEMRAREEHEEQDWAETGKVVQSLENQISRNSKQIALIQSHVEALSLKLDKLEESGSQSEEHKINVSDPNSLLWHLLHQINQQPKAAQVTQSNVSSAEMSDSNVLIYVLLVVGTLAVAFAGFTVHNKLRRPRPLRRACSQTTFNLESLKQ